MPNQNRTGFFPLRFPSKSGRPTSFRAEGRILTDHLRAVKTLETTMQFKTMKTLIAASTLFSIGHHVDHILRGNHVGWPLIPPVTPFTQSLGFYPVIAVGYLFYLKSKVGYAFWSILAGVGLGFVGLTHLGSVAREPPRDILGAYASPLAGLVAFLWSLPSSWSRS